MWAGKTGGFFVINPPASENKSNNECWIVLQREDHLEMIRKAEISAEFRK